VSLKSASVACNLTPLSPNGDVSLYGKRVEDEDSLAKRIIDASIAVKTE
jgi:hypothetical protein